MKKPLILAGIAAGLAVAVGLVWLQAAAPSIGPVAASPAYIVINTPTAVTFTAQITDPSIIATGVNLLRVDAAGRTLSTVGVMRDDGTSGDAVAGDRTFSLRLNVNESAVGQLHYRVSAAFRGVLQRVLSPLVVVTVDPVPLPPDPGEAGRQTLEGVDSDQDGVRDDVQRFIAISQIGQPRLQTALTLLTKRHQEFILQHDGTKSTIRAVDLERRQASDCLEFVAGLDRASILARQLRAEILNTKARSLAYAEADRQLGGMVYSLSDPSTYKDRCGF